jgi:hypothetical protein
LERLGQSLMSTHSFNPFISQPSRREEFQRQDANPDYSDALLKKSEVFLSWSTIRMHAGPEVERDLTWDAFCFDLAF